MRISYRWLLFAALARFNLTFVAQHGRYLFPAAGPMLILLMVGIVLVIILATLMPMLEITSSLS